MTTYLIDTNVLLRGVDPYDALHPVVRRAILALRAQGHDLRIASQNAVEFWNVVTRPVSRNGFGLLVTDADRLLRLVERFFAVLPDLPSVYSIWRQIVVSFSVAGVQVHDARLVAVMQVHAVTHILTFNTRDFSRYAPVGIVS